MHHGKWHACKDWFIIKLYLVSIHHNKKVIIIFVFAAAAPPHADKCHQRGTALPNTMDDRHISTRQKTAGTLAYHQITFQPPSYDLQAQPTAYKRYAVASHAIPCTRKNR